MSLISKELWETEFTEPMPEGTTYWDFVYKREAQWLGGDTKVQLELITKLEGLAKTDSLSDFIDNEKKNLQELYKKQIKLRMGGVRGE